MTLINRILIAMTGLLLIILISTYIITMNNARNFLIEQMNSNAQDTATSLGISLSQAVANQDNAMMLSMVEAAFDNGFFSMVEVRNIRGELLISRYVPKRQNQAPDWFIDLIQWPSSVKNSVIMNGWKQNGEVLVLGDTNYACNTLWKNAVHLIYWDILFIILSLVCMFFLLRGFLKPLQRVISQAESIGRGNFQVETILSETTELKKLTLAMNQIANHNVVNNNNPAPGYEKPHLA